MDRDRLFELYVVCLADRKRPDSKNGNQDAEDLALSDAIRAYTRFENRMNDLDFDLRKVREGLSV